MRRASLLLLCGLFLATAWEVRGQDPPSKQAKIKSAMSAAPASISAQATVKGRDGSVLREGINGWTCYPDDPDREGQNPMCLDGEWDQWVEARRNQRTPNVTQIGISYMLAGGSPASNTDPSATSPTPDNQWMETVPPHLMIILPNSEMYEGLPTNPDNGGPWVMWPDTPYAHIMVPTSAPE